MGKGCLVSFVAIGLISCLIMLVGGLVSGFSSEPGNIDENAKKETVQPQGEVDFINSNQYLKNRYQSAKNDLQNKDEINYAKRYFCHDKDLSFVNEWVGVVSDIDQTYDGRAILAIKINDFISIETWGNFLSDASDKTTIEKNSSVYKDVYESSIGDKVMFSGSFVKNSNGCLVSTGKPDEVGFIFRFTKVTAIKK